MNQITRAPLRQDGSPMQLRAMMLPDAAGVFPIRMLQAPRGPDGSPLNVDAQIFVDQNGNLYSLPSATDVSNLMNGPRTMPLSGFAYMDDIFGGVITSGYGAFRKGYDLTAAFDRKFNTTVGSAYAWADTALGTDSPNVGWPNPMRPLKTLTYMRTQVGISTTFLMPGYYDAGQFMGADAYGTHAQKLIAPYGGVTIGWPGDALSAATFTQDGTTEGWQTTLATSNLVASVLVTINGVETPLQKLLAMPSTTPVPADSPTPCFFFNIGTKVLTIWFGKVNVNTSKALFRAVYGKNSSGAVDNLIFINDTVIYAENITFDGYPFVYNNGTCAVSNTDRPGFWGKNCIFQHSVSTGIEVEGGDCFLQDCLIRFPATDGITYNLRNAAARGLEDNLQVEYPGDVFRFPLALTDKSAPWTSVQTQIGHPVTAFPNKNLSSLHPSCFAVRIGGGGGGAYGPAYADAGTSLNLGLNGAPSVGNNSLGNGFSMFVDAGGVVYVDSCLLIQNGNGRFNVEATGALLYRNTPLGTVLGTGSVTSY